MIWRLYLLVQPSPIANCSSELVGSETNYQQMKCQKLAFKFSTERADCGLSLRVNKMRHLEKVDAQSCDPICVCASAANGSSKPK
jgi:hypothetical protein